LRALKGGGQVLKRTGEDAAHSDKARMLHQLLKLTNRLMAPFSTHLSHRYKISLNEFRLLMTIGALERTASHELAELTGVNVMSVSRAVATLERHGRIEVVRDTANRRRKWLTLTPEGQRLYAIMRPQSEKVADYLFSELRSTEVEQLGTILTTLIGTLEATDAQGRSLFIERTKPDSGRE
jgi:DNA-binding MarR family transcriptional regulator